MRGTWGILALMSGAVADDHIVLPPTTTDTSLPEKMLLFIPGGGVPNAHYTETARAIQKATTNQRLWVTIPTILGNLCIPQCSTSFLCSPLHATTESALKIAVDQGWNRGDDAEDMWLAGHSLGGICANTLFQAYHGNYAALLVMGSYVDQDGAYSVTNYPKPVLTLNVELDYGGARPGKTSIWWKQHLEFAKSSGDDAALKQKPVIILPGLNHSDFCPGFDVPGDLPAEVDQGRATEVIADAVSSFLSAQLGDSNGLAHLKAFRDGTHVWMDPYLQAEAMERSDQSGTEGTSSVCEQGAHLQAGLSATDDAHLKVTDQFFVKNSNLEHCHPAYEADGSDLKVTSCSHTDYYSDVGNTGYFACSKQVACKWLSSDRLAEQLHTTAEKPDVTCKDINMQTVQMAEALAPKATLERFKQKGRGWCFEDDSSVTGNIGPLWLKSNIKLTETADCMSVSSMALHTSLESKIFPGSNYCKLLSPTRVLDWMMTDSLKPFGGSVVLV
jgi:hypothetical protein